jgi:hypothetical protein
MLRKASSVKFHSSEDVEEYLRQALVIMGAADLAPSLHDATLAKLVELLSLQQIQVEQVGPLGLRLEGITT